MFMFPWGDFHSLNLGWFLQKFNELREDWATAEAGIDGALDAEIQKAEDALTDVFAAKDAAAASATAAAGSASSAGTSATAAQNSATAAASSATLANNKATAAGLSEAAAAQSATQAGNSATAAAGSATAAGQSATNAAGSATAAGQSATNAAGSATAAGNSATAAATSETNAEASAERAEEAAAAANKGAVIKSVENVPIESVDDALAENVVGLVIAIAPVQAGTGDPAPDNIRPITGWIGANVCRTGINIFNEQWESGAFQAGTGQKIANAAWSRSVDFISVKPNTSYYFYVEGVTTPESYYIFYYDANKSYITHEQRIDNNIKTIPANCYYINIMYKRTIDVINNYDAAINYPSSDTSYHPGMVANYPVALPVSAGTVYGGTLDVTNGVLTVDKAKVDLGTLSWVKNDHATLGTYFYANVVSLGIKDRGEYSQIVPNAICSNYVAARRYPTIFTNGTFCYDGSATAVTQLQIKDSTYSDAPSFAAAMSGVDLVYELAAPLEYTLTDSEVITLLNGINNIWANTGDVALLRYYADSKSYIDEQGSFVKALIAKELDNMQADTALTANDFRIVNNTLYRITSPVASGATLTPGTNCETTTVADVLKTLLT